MRPEAHHTRKNGHGKQPKFKGPTKDRLTALVRAFGAEEAGFIDADTTEHHKPARREQRGAEG